MSVARRPWTGGEIRTLRAHYPRHGARWDGWDELLPGRTHAAIGSAANRLGIRPPSDPEREEARALRLARAKEAVAALTPRQRENLRELFRYIKPNQRKAV